MEEVCDEKGIDSIEVQHEIDIILNTKTTHDIDFKSWPIDLLIDYIEKVHHRYVEVKSDVLLLSLIHI